jgi:cytochrome d ubiquinol oxidase subunit I
MLAVSWAGLWLLRRRGAADLPRAFLWALLGMTFSGWLATLAGWYVTEIGRQPWLVTGVLTTKAALGPVATPMVLSTLIAYVSIYLLLLGSYVWVIFDLARKAATGEPIRDRHEAPTAATLPAAE